MPLGKHCAAFADYLVQFRVIDGAVEHAPRGEFALVDAPVRDFLMELGAVRHRPTTKSDVIEDSEF
jgi:hypothetical protein